MASNRNTNSTLPTPPPQLTDAARIDLLMQRARSDVTARMRSQGHPLPSPSLQAIEAQVKAHMQAERCAALSIELLAEAEAGLKRLDLTIPEPVQAGAFATGPSPNLDQRKEVLEDARKGSQNTFESGMEQPSPRGPRETPVTVFSKQSLSASSSLSPLRHACEATVRRRAPMVEESVEGVESASAEEAVDIDDGCVESGGWQSVAGFEVQGSWNCGIQ